MNVEADVERTEYFVEYLVRLGIKSVELHVIPGELVLGVDIEAELGHAYFLDDILGK